MYLMVLLVRRRIHWGIGRFCFCALASFCLVRKDLWDCENRQYGVPTGCVMAAPAAEKRTGIVTAGVGCRGWRVAALSEASFKFRPHLWCADAAKALVHHVMALSDHSSWTGALKGGFLARVRRCKC